MGWKGTLRTIQAEMRRAEREAKRRQRELERERKQLAKMQELERARYEVQAFENYTDLLLSIHKECSQISDWEAIHCSEARVKPTNPHPHEQTAQRELDEFKPGTLDRVLGRTGSRRARLVEAVEQARRVDGEEYQEVLSLLST